MIFGITNEKENMVMFNTTTKVEIVSELIEKYKTSKTTKKFKVDDFKVFMKDNSVDVEDNPLIIERIFKV